MNVRAQVQGTSILDAPVSGAVPGIVGLLIGLFAVFFIAVIVLMVVSATKRYRAAKRAGLDPFAGDIQMMQTARESQLMAPARSVEERLAEVDELRRAGTITAEEHTAARARIIGTV